MGTKTSIIFKTGLLLCLLTLLSCSEDRDDRENCLSYETAYITAIDAPSNAQVGQELVVELDFQVRNGCGQFHQFLESASGTSRTIEIEAKYEGCICTQDMPIREVPYRFTPETTGEHILRFLTGEEEYEEVTILVEAIDE